jgi:hypothetical protein
MNILYLLGITEEDVAEALRDQETEPEHSVD